MSTTSPYPTPEEYTPSWNDILDGHVDPKMLDSLLASLPQAKEVDSIATPPLTDTLPEDSIISMPAPTPEKAAYGGLYRVIRVLKGFISDAPLGSKWRARP